MTMTPARFAEEDLVRLMKAHQTGVWRYLLFLGCPEDLVDQIVQDVFVAVWRRPFEYRGPLAAAAYLRRVARGLFVSECRRRRARAVFRDLDAAESVWLEEAGPDEGQSHLDALRACLSQLPERVRVILSLFYKDGWSRTRIAEHCRITADGVKTTMRRARSALRACISRRLA